MRDRLIELICEAIQEDNCVAHCNYPPCNKCKSIADHLLSNGAIMPPCKVGGTVYRLVDIGIQTMPEIEMGRVECIKFYSGVLSLFCTFRSENLYVFAKDFGKTVFLTREEAKAKLKKGE